MMMMMLMMMMMMMMMMIIIIIIIIIIIYKVQRGIPMFRYTVDIKIIHFVIQTKLAIEDYTGKLKLTII